MSKKQKPLSYAEFTRELTKAVEGDPSADRSVAAFWDGTSRGLGTRVTVAGPQGVEVLREDDTKGAKR